MLPRPAAAVIMGRSGSPRDRWVRRPSEPARSTAPATLVVDRCAFVRCAISTPVGAVIGSELRGASEGAPRLEVRQNLAVTDGDILRQQIAYYRRRAVEYDDWSLRVGHPTEDGQRRWAQEMLALDDAFAVMPIAGAVLELAAGTGNYTTRLVSRASRVTAIDAAPEALALARTKLPDSARVEFVEADIFDWEPDHRFDCVFFAYWLTHVPTERFDEFWRLVERCVRPGGAVSFVDNAVPLEVAARTLDQEAALGVPYSSTANERSVRELASGERFAIVKRMWSPAELAARLDTLGWSASVGTTPKGVFVHGVARVRATGRPGSGS